MMSFFHNKSQNSEWKIDSNTKKNPLISPRQEPNLDSTLKAFAKTHETTEKNDQVKFNTFQETSQLSRLKIICNSLSQSPRSPAKLSKSLRLSKQSKSTNSSQEGEWTDPEEIERNADTGSSGEEKHIDEFSSSDSPSRRYLEALPDGSTKMKRKVIGLPPFSPAIKNRNEGSVEVQGKESTLEDEPFEDMEILWQRTYGRPRRRNTRYSSPENQSLQLVNSQESMIDHFVNTFQEDPDLACIIVGSSSLVLLLVLLYQWIVRNAYAGLEAVAKELEPRSL